MLLPLLFAFFFQAPPMEPFEMVWRAGEGVAADVSFLLEAPAGKTGFLRSAGGRIVRPDGKPFRIWGVNFSFVASLPAKEDAPAVAAHLARFGVNCVRVHHLDWRTPRGIIDSKFPDSRHLDPDRLDRLDFFISELKKRGIYVDLNLNVARAFQEADGVKDAASLGFAKAVTYFDPRMIELQKEYAKTLLTHRNPYTATEYRNEPAVALVEIVNENSLIEAWVAGRLQGKGPDPKQTDQTWADIPASYERDLSALFEKYMGAPEPRLLPNQFKEASPARFEKEAAFYMDLENRFLQQMLDYLKKELGVKSLAVGTSIHNGGLTPYPLLASTAKLDVVDGHTYWQHPSYGTDAQTGRRTFRIPNTAMVNQPEKSTILTLGRVAVAGKPYIVSEVNHPYPNEYAAEMIPILAAYGAFQGWDGLFWYSFEHSEAANWNSRYPSHFDIRQDPVKMSQLAAAAVMFQRGDVSPARKTITRTYTREQVMESIRLPRGESPLYTPGMPPALALRHGIRVGSLDGPPTGNFPPVESPLKSDTAQLRWQLDQEKQGQVAIDTPRAQALVGYLSAASTRHLSVQLENKFCALLLVSLDGKPVARSTRMLLTAGARTGNTGMKWNDARTTLLETGSGPITIETVRGKITLRGLARAKTVTLQPLDGAGRPLPQKVQATSASGGWVATLGETVTPWYELSVER